MQGHLPGGGEIPTWLTALLSIASTIGAWWAWRPIGTWIGRRIESDRQTKLAERREVIARMTVELTTTKEENLDLRRELAEERELRMSFASDVAVLNERLEHLTRAMAEDKRDCQREIRRLNGEVRRLQTEVTELRRRHEESAP